jgi:hypothetical protein
MILDVALQMLREMIDALRQQRDLNIGRTGVLFVQLERFDSLSFSFHTKRVFPQELRRDRLVCDYCGVKLFNCGFWLGRKAPTQFLIKPSHLSALCKTDSINTNG